MAAAAVASRSTAQKAALALGAGLAAGFGAYYITQVRSEVVFACLSRINMTMHAGPAPDYKGKILDTLTLKWLVNTQQRQDRKITDSLGVLH
jgi:hypothetical protein